jgi:hypothetical protein
LQSFNPNAGVLMPVSVTAVNPKIKTPTIYNYSAGVQKDVGFGTVVDIAYVAALGRQLTQTEALNTLPYGTRFLPQSIDPTRGTSPLPDTFLVPYLGYSGISIPRTSSSNYHSLQAQANRRFSKGLQFGVSYTWSKSMGYTGNYPVYLNNRLSYGKTSLDRTHTLSINALYDLPQGSKLWNVPVMRAVTDRWQMSVVPYFSSGRPWAVGYSLTSGTDLTGGGDWTRAVVLSDPTLAHGDRTFSRFFNTSAFAPPTKGTIGNAPVDVFRGPGRSNLDVALFKNFKIVEKISAQFRFEAFNVLNHVSFWQLDNTARFDATGAQVNARFGQETAAMEGRVLKVSVRISF